MSGAPRLLAIGTASPATSLSPEVGLAMARRLSPDADGARLAALFASAGVSRRGSVVAEGGACERLLDPCECRLGPTTPSRLAWYAEVAGALAAEAARQALDRAGLAVGAVTHLVTVSCTGAESPGLDHGLIRRLGLSAGISRTHVGFMGCHGAINGLAVAEAFALAKPGAVVMVVCAEVCSLHHQAGGSWDQEVANAIFADGAACAVVGCSASPGAASCPEIRAFGSRVFPGTDDLMSWTIGEHGFAMRLSPRVPGVLRRGVGAWVDSWLGGLGLTRSEVSAWAVHPGGRDILAGVERGLGLDERALAVSRGVLDRHGNMSSGTVLWVIDELVRGGARGLIATLSFGPGITGEGMLMEVTGG